MSEPRKIDPFTDNIVRRIDARVRDSLTPAQLEAIIQAIETQDPQDHVVHVRWTIPLFLSRFYAVFVICRDRRASTQRAEATRGKRMSWTGGLLFVALVGLPFFLLLFFFLYLLKLMLGLDVFPEFHLWDILH
jgi:hypothetical protein